MSLGTARWVGRIILVGFAAIQSWVDRHTFNPDGISYIEIAELYARGEWRDALNAYWGPLYSWMLAPVPLLGATPRWEFPAVHAINLAIFIVALIAFERFVRALIETHATPPHEGSPWIWMFGYAVFGWSSLVLVGVTWVTPDLLALAVVLGAGAYIVRVEQGATDRRVFVLLGVFLGAAYLAKSFFLVVGVAALAILFLRHPGRRYRVVLSAVVFGAVTGPFIAAISWKSGRLTTGEAGRLNLAWEMGRLEPAYRHWQGSEARFGAPKHPSRQLSSSPALFEFAEPVPGSYPVWFDPSYWYAGARAAVSPKLQVRHFLQSVATYAATFGALFIALVVFALAPGVRGSTDIVRRHPTLLLLSGLGFLLYAIVLLLDRYIAPFVVLSGVAVGVTAMIRDATNVRLHRACTLALASIWLLGALPQIVHSADIVRRELTGASLNAIRPYQQAVEFQRLGVRSGDRIATVGDGFTAFWAHLARVRITAEVPTWETPTFWNDAAARERTLNTLRSHGVRAVVTQDVPPPHESHLWMPVDDGRWHVRFLEPAA